MWISSAIPCIRLFCHQQTRFVIFIFFHVPSIILSNVYFYTARSMFPFIFNWSQSKASVIKQMSHLFFEAQKYFFCSFQLFEIGHILIVVSTLINVMKLDVENNSIVLTSPDVVNINIEITTMLRPRRKVSWVLTNIAKRLHNFVKCIKLKTYIFSRIPLNCCFRKLSKRYW